MPDDVQAERERCAEVAACLAEKWEATAAKLRSEGTCKPWFGKPYVKPFYERDAKTIDAAAQGIRAIERVIRSGAKRA